MRAEIISIGDELTSGQRLDTNSAWLSQRLGELGVPVVAHATVADDLETNVTVFRQAIERAELVIATGGLGPTADDLTREVLARLAGTPLELDPPSLEHIRSLFERRKRSMPERNVVQAMFPRGSRVLFNPEGTAPGIALDVRNAAGRTSAVFALPGVPAEMKPMWHDRVVPELQARGVTGRVIRHKRVKCFGVGESALEQMLPDLIRRGREPSVGITVHEGTITLRITAQAETSAACHAAMDDTLQTIHDCLGLLVFGYEDDELEHAVARLLIERGETLATCETDTGGLLSNWLGSLTTGRTQIAGSMVLRAPCDVPARIVPGENMAMAGPSAEAACALAAGVRQAWNVDYGLALASFPASAGDVSPTGEVFGAIATSTGVESFSSSLGSHSAIVRPLAAKQALNRLRLALLRR